MSKAFQKTDFFETFKVDVFDFFEAFKADVWFSVSEKLIKVFESKFLCSKKLLKNGV